jgi:hypothetical protein
MLYDGDMFDILNKRIIRVWMTSGTSSYPLKHIKESDDLIFIRIMYYGDCVFDLHTNPNKIESSLIDWDYLCNYDYYINNQKVATGGIEFVYWDYIQQVFIKIENELNVPIDSRWWDIVNRMKEIYEEIG